MNDFDNFGGCLADEEYYKEQQFYKKQENKKKKPKLTDEQIVKGLKCCTNTASGKCLNECPYYDYSPKCSLRMCNDVIKFINRLKAENERLFARNFELSEKGERVCVALKTAKSEAYKEFAEKLKEEQEFHIDECGNFVGFVAVSRIDNFLKQKVGS